MSPQPEIGVLNSWTSGVWEAVQQKIDPARGVGGGGTGEKVQEGRKEEEREIIKKGEDREEKLMR